MAGLRILVALVTALAVVCALAAAARADVTTLYAPQEIARDAKRLETAARKIFTLGLKPALTAREAQALTDVPFVFPLPQPGDPIVNFYASWQGNRASVILPIVSLKVIEDMALAYAWLYHRQKTLDTIDFYFAMLRHKPKSAFPRQMWPNPLKALGIPDNALQDKAVDDLSLRLRNEAFAFMIAHELGHVYLEHKESYDQITRQKARDDEVAADLFALDLLARTETPPMGALLYFQSQAYSLPHRGDFPTRDAWEDYLTRTSTHPMTVDRLKTIATFLEGRFASARPSETAIWAAIGQGVRGIVAVLEDEALYRCLQTAASRAPLELLKPRDSVATETYLRLCRP